MKYPIISLIFLSLLFLSGCNDSITDTPEYKIIKENHTSGYAFPDEGFYYKYDNSSYDEHIASVLDTLILFYDSGIKVKNAWFRSYLIGCSPPGASWFTMTIYPETFILQVNQEDSLLNKHKFSKINISQYSIGCGYNVKRYKLK
jgi:hypothetical protein